MTYSIVSLLVTVNLLEMLYDPNEVFFLQEAGSFVFAIELK